VNLAAKTLKAVLPYAGLILLILLCSEECRRLVSYFWQVTRQEPRLKIILYPLAALLMVGAAALIAHSVFVLFTTVTFSYE
jgi:predicted nucleic acid-binding Zn ribbon protein